MSAAVRKLRIAIIILALAKIVSEFRSVLVVWPFFTDLSEYGGKGFLQWLLLAGPPGGCVSCRSCRASAGRQE